MTEIQRSIDGWECSDIGNSCNEFIMEGPLSKVSGQAAGLGSHRSRLTERHAFLFDGQIVLCKPNTKRSSVTAAVTGRDASTSNCDWRLKEKFLIRNIEISDKEDFDRNSNFYLPAFGCPLLTSNFDSVSLSRNGETSPLTSTVGGGDCQSITSSVCNLSLVGSLPQTSLLSGPESGLSISSSFSSSNSAQCQNMRYAFEIKSESQNQNIVLVTKVIYNY